MEPLDIDCYDQTTSHKIEKVRHKITLIHRDPGIAMITPSEALRRHGSDKVTDHSYGSSLRHPLRSRPTTGPSNP